MPSSFRPSGNIVSAISSSRLCCLILALAAWAVVGGVQAQPVVERVSFTPRSDGGGYVVRVHTNDFVSGYYAPQQEGRRVTWRLFNVKPSRSLQRDEAEGPVSTYDVRTEDRFTVVELELASEEVTLKAYRDRASTDLLLNIGTADVPVVTAGHTDVPEASAPAGRTVSGSRWTLDTIVIDAGHGGKDAGATANGLREKDVVLAVARKLGAYIEQYLGDVEIVYTRDDDRFIELNERGRIANEAGGKLFVSIHANAARNTRAHGTETYFLGMHRTNSAQRVMERENSVVRLESNPDHYKALDQQELILRTLAQSAYMRKSEELAGLVQNQFQDRVGRKNRGVKQAGFYVLWSASMPAILVELGFVTNRSDASFLRSDDGQAYLASAIFRAVRDFKEAYERDISVSSSE